MGRGCGRDLRGNSESRKSELSEKTHTMTIINNVSITNLNMNKKICLYACFD
jgi:hypothetical protein